MATGTYTCPWCGTSYLTFQPNCSNCGGPMLPPDQKAAAAGPGAELPVPPPAPRSISPRYALRLLSSDGWAIVGLVFGILGVVFGVVGVALTIAVVTAMVGLPFAVLGIVYLVGAVPLLIWRFRKAQRTVTVLREGVATKGQVTEAAEQYSVTVNGRHPWVIRYEFQVDGENYDGKVTTLNSPGPELAMGKPVRILYLPGAPKWSSIYPHP